MDFTLFPQSSRRQNLYRVYEHSSILFFFFYFLVFYSFQKKIIYNS